MPDIPTLDAALDPNDPLRRGLLPLAPPRPQIPPLTMLPRPATMGAPSLVATPATDKPASIGPTLVPSRQPAAAGGAPTLNSTPRLSATPKIEAPIPAGGIVMPNPNDPRYRPLGGWRAALADIAQLSPDQGARDIGLRELGAPSERLKTDTEAARNELERRNVESQITEREGKPAPGTPEAQTFNDLMTGGDGGGPRIDPATKQPYTTAGALAVVKQAEAKPEAPKEFKTFTVGGQPVLGQQRGDKIFDANGADITSQAKPYEKPAENRFEELPIRGANHKVELNSKGEIVKDWGAIPQTPAEQNQGTEVVRGFDKNGRPVLTSEADARAQGLTKVTKASDKDIDSARTHTVVLNDMQAKLNDVVSTSKALDQDVEQRAIIAKALGDQKNTTFGALVGAGVLSKATPATKDYIQSVLSLRESALGLPKEITGGSRVSEVQSSALWATLPSAASLDSRYALGQAKKFQANIDRLWGRVDNFQGLPREAPISELSGKSLPDGAVAGTMNGKHGYVLNGEFHAE